MTAALRATPVIPNISKRLVAADLSGWKDGLAGVRTELRLLLDTCTFLWLNVDLQQLPVRVRDACEASDNELYLSAASAWEIAVKSAANRLRLPAEPAVWVPSRREQNGIEPLPISENAVV